MANQQRAHLQAVTTIARRRATQYEPAPEPAAPSKAECLTWSVKDAATIIGVCERTLRSRLRDGTLPSLKLGDRVFVRKDVVAAFMAGEKNSNA